MVNERTPEILRGARWYRDTANNYSPIGLHEITRFPHAVLEIKLEVQDESATPQWVSDLIASGKLLEVHKFSKFIHGCAVLLPREVYALPYWVDDMTLRDSIVRSGGGCILPDYVEDVREKQREREREKLLKASGGSSKKGNTSPSSPSNGNSSTFNPMLPSTNVLTKRSSAVGRMNTNMGSARPSIQSQYGEQSISGSNPMRDIEAGGSNKQQTFEVADGDDDKYQKSERTTCCFPVYNMVNSCCEGFAEKMMHSEGCCGSGGLFDWAESTKTGHLATQKVEPKLFFANERTYLSWLQMAVTMTSIAVIISAFASTDCKFVLSLLCVPIHINYSLSLVFSGDTNYFFDHFTYCIIIRFICIAYLFYSCEEN